MPPLGPAANALLDRLATGFTVEEAGEVKAVERTTNHDVKAIEYVLKDKFAADPELAKVRRSLAFFSPSEGRLRL